MSSKGGPKVRALCGKVNLDRVSGDGVGFPASHGESHGSELSAAQSAAHQQARISQTDEDGLGTRRLVPAAEEGAQASHRTSTVEAPEPLTRERLPRRVRLTRGSDLTACLEAGRRRRTPHLDLAWRPNPAGYARIGIIVPRHQCSAVARNRLRRRLREILRRVVAPQLPPIDLVVRAKRAAYSAPFAMLRAELTDAIALLS